MEQNEKDIIESTNDTETTENTEVIDLEVEEADEPSEDVEALKKKLATTEAQKEHWRTKAQKTQEKPVESTTSEMSLKDSVALINAKVHEDDIDEVLDYAKYKKISIAEALKSSVVKKSLEERNEQRATAEATNTSKSRGTSSRISEEALLSKAQKTGEIPESADDLNRMLNARYSK